MGIGLFVKNVLIKMGGFTEKKTKKKLKSAKKNIFKKTKNFY
jgi:hypothetical protein